METMLSMEEVIKLRSAISSLVISTETNQEVEYNVDEKDTYKYIRRPITWEDNNMSLYKYVLRPIFTYFLRNHQKSRLHLPGKYRNANGK